MKTIKDPNPSRVLTAIGAILMSPVVFHFGFHLSAFGSAYVSFCVIFILAGLWRFEAYEIKEGILIKYNLGGYVKRKRTLSDLVSIKKQMLKSSIANDLLSTLYLIKKNPKYSTYRYLTLKFGSQRKLIVNELMIKRTEFNKLYRKLRKYEGLDQ